MYIANLKIEYLGIEINSKFDCDNSIAFIFNLSHHRSEWATRQISFVNLSKAQDITGGSIVLNK
jgi:hypothetical protein